MGEGPIITIIHWGWCKKRAYHSFLSNKRMYTTYAVPHGTGLNIRAPNASSTDGWDQSSLHCWQPRRSRCPGIGKFPSPRKMIREKLLKRWRIAKDRTYQRNSKNSLLNKLLSTQSTVQDGLSNILRGAWEDSLYTRTTAGAGHVWPQTHWSRWARAARDRHCACPNFMWSAAD
jgi:hypothetical protein